MSGESRMRNEGETKHIPNLILNKVLLWFFPAFMEPV
jgi:hypothetical protein